MAGANKLLKSGNVVFKAGDPADGMYLVRKGELVVYLEQGGKEVILARIGEGAMVGEMALFDRQPRSASVKASQDTEITHISLDDFGKLMKQIPKWFVSLMTSLSGRLRTTNDRLKQLETKAPAVANVATPGATSGPTKPYQNTMRMLNVIELLWHRDGTKEGKDWCLQKKIVEEQLTQMFAEPPAKIAALLDVLVQEQVISTRNDNYKNVILVMANRGALRQFCGFLTDFVTSNPNMSILPEGTMNILRVVAKLIPKAPYEQFTSPMEEILQEAQTAGYNPEGWTNIARSMTGFGEAVKPVKSSTKAGIGLRVVKAEFPGLLRNLNALGKLHTARLD